MKSIIITVTVDGTDLPRVHPAEEPSATQGLLLSFSKPTRRNPCGDRCGEPVPVEMLGLEARDGTTRGRRKLGRRREGEMKYVSKIWTRVLFMYEIFFFFSRMKELRNPK